MFTFAPATPGTAPTGVLHPHRHFAGDRTSGRRQRHLDTDKTVVVYINIVNEPELVNIRWNFRVIDGFQRRNDGIRQMAQLFRRHLRGGPEKGVAAGGSGGSFDIIRVGLRLVHADPLLEELSRADQRFRQRLDFVQGIVERKRGSAGGGHPEPLQ